MQLANQRAVKLNHEYISGEHILLGLVMEGGGVGANVIKDQYLERTGSKHGLQVVRLAIEKLIQTNTEFSVVGKLPKSPRGRRIIDFAVDEAAELGHKYIGSEDLLLGLLREPEGIAADVLKEHGIMLHETRQAIQKSLGREPADDQSESKLTSQREIENELTRSSFVSKLNDRAKRVLSFAEMTARVQHGSVMDTQHLLVGIIAEGTNDGAFCLKLKGLNLLRIQASTLR